MFVAKETKPIFSMYKLACVNNVDPDQPLQLQPDPNIHCLHIIETHLLEASVN